MIDANNLIAPDENPDRTEQARFLLHLRSEGVRDANVLRAMEQIPRRLFLNAKQHLHALSDCALPIECGQTISAPSIVGIMSSELQVTKNCLVFEVGTGSGYQTAILSKLAHQVYTSERFRTLLALAKNRLRTLNIRNVSFLHSDGTLGLPKKGPFDRILLTAASPETPKQLKDQLKDGGIMILPVGGESEIQKLIKITRVGNNFNEQFICNVRFVPIKKGITESL